MRDTIKLLLIDLDDTLWATKINNKQALRELYTALSWGQYFLSFDEFYSIYEPINYQLWEQYNQGIIDREMLSRERLRKPLEPFVSHTDEEWQAIDDTFLHAVRRQTLLCEGALEAMAYLKSRYSICILSNGFGSLQYDKIERSGLSPYVDHVVLSDEVGLHKPQPEIFQLALERMGYAASEALMIGDSYSSDIVGASRAGIRSIWYSPEGYTLQVDADITPPIATITDLRQLIELL